MEIDAVNETYLMEESVDTTSQQYPSEAVLALTKDTIVVST